MTSSYTQAAASAKKIMDLLGTGMRAGTRLALSGRSPNMPHSGLRDLCSPSSYEGIGESARTRISKVLDRQLSCLRDHFMRHFWQMAEQQHSLEEYGMPDVEVEDSLLLICESRYNRCLEDICSLLSRYLTRPGASMTDNSNTRGGFGDVSPPNYITQANISANPPNPGNSIQLHRIPPLNRDRPLVKINFIGTSSSTSPSSISISIIHS